MNLPEAQSKGEMLVGLMAASAESGCNVQSKDFDFAQLAANSWTQTIAPSAEMNGFIMFLVKSVLVEKRWPIGNPDNEEITLHHSQEKELPDATRILTTFGPTEGSYESTFNRYDIVALNSPSPQSAVARQTPTSGSGKPQLPQLSHRSDVMYLQWKKFCDDHVFDHKDLRFIIQKSIINEQITAIIKKVLGGKEPNDWPGSVFAKGSKEWQNCLRHRMLKESPGC